MLLLDLRWTLFGLLLAWCATVAVAVALDRWLQRRAARGEALGTEALGQVLERAPFGLLVLEGPRRLGYANALARRLLNLPASPTLPETLWAERLQEDQLAARDTPDGAGRYRTVALPSEQVARWWVVPARQWDVVVVQDVTAQHWAEQGATFMLSDLSHELRTPLATLLTHLEVLRLPGLPTETRDQSVSLRDGPIICRDK